MKVRDLNATAASLLGLLHEGEQTGWDLVNLAQERIGNFWTLTQSQVYRELGRMAEDGLVLVGERGARDKKPYQISESGRLAFAEWINGDPAKDQIRVPLLLTILFSAHLEPGRLKEILATERAAHAERLETYEHHEKKMAWYAEIDGERNELRRATLKFGIQHEQAVLAWFDELPELLNIR